MTGVFITIDTEYSYGLAARKRPVSHAENFARSISCETPDGAVGIGYQMDVFDRYGIKGVFFVDPMPAFVYGVEAIADIVGPIVARGHDVQLHLHAEWLALAGNANPLGNRTGRNIRDFAFEEQCQLIDHARGVLMAAGAPRPVAFRAGNYGANDDTLRALAELGFTHETSHCPGIAASECGIALGAEDRHPMARHGVVEVPIGCIDNFGEGLRHAQLTALSAPEMKAALLHARDEDFASFTLVSHSFELLCRNRRRINRIVRHRFESLCETVATIPDLYSATYAANPPAALERGEPRPVLPLNSVRSGWRVAEQAVANALYAKEWPRRARETATMGIFMVC
ncbi:polysaccharide deacetylase family protein [Qipengyuania spongiae]|uniref:Chitooligosaccharide deacetylase n=1 Tax=Qipengyuania spongiae TaxID=2909673 RepID=A0ABY5T1J2_9SPHN|nr:hypothetical protein [Qipengyuania spongiae]UVI40379.1 hypothetical protein L1F33_05400 [Qipengyuania spongiae]